MATTWNISIQGEGTPLNDLQPRVVRFIDSLGTGGIPVANATITSFTTVTLAGGAGAPASGLVPLAPTGETTTVDLTPPKKGKKS